MKKQQVCHVFLALSSTQMTLLFSVRKLWRNNKNAVIKIYPSL